MRFRSGFLCFLLAQAAGPLLAQTWHVVVGSNAASLERYAAEQTADGLRRARFEVEPIPVVTETTPRARRGRVVVVGTPKCCILLRELIARGWMQRETRREGYSLAISANPFDRSGTLVAIAGADERGALWGVRDFVHYHLPSLRSPRRKQVCVAAAPALQRRGLWTWGGRIFDYVGYLDHMSEWKMNTLIVWNNHAPTNARAFLRHAHSRGIDVIWGFSWCWGYNVNPSSEADRKAWKDRVLEIYRREYAPLHPDGIYFQTFTEGGLHGSPLLKQKGEGEWFVEWVTPILQALWEISPDLWISCGVHFNPDMDDSYRALAAVDPHANILWEDVGSFPFAGSPAQARGAEETLKLARSLTGLRGAQEDVGFIVKGLYAGLWGATEPAPIGVSDPEVIEAMANERAPQWRLVEAGWRRNGEHVLELARITAASKAKRTCIVGLVENGLWEARQWLPVVTLAESLWDPFRSLGELLASVERVPTVVSLYNPEQNRIHHLAVGKPVTLTKAYSPNYTGGGDRALTDGWQADAEVFDPHWQGYSGEDLEAIVDLGKPTGLHQISTRYLQDVPMGVFLPPTVQYAVSDDGTDFRTVATLAPGIPPTDRLVQVRDFTASSLNTRARYVRVCAKNLGPIPSWHLAAGAMAWLFVDEIVVR